MKVLIIIGLLNIMQQQSKTMRDYVYNSQMKTRDKFSIKNLLEDPGLERNYASQQSDRGFRTSTARPQTMYGERVRMFLNDQNKKIKMQTEIKMKRQQSSYKINRCNSGVQLKTVTQQDKIKMKKALGKVNLLAEGNIMNIEQQEQIQAIFNFIGCLTEVNNHYQNAFEYIAKKMKSIVFVSNDNQLAAAIKQLADRTKNQILINIIYRNLGKTTFETLCKQLLKQTKKAVKMMQQAQKKQSNGQQKNIQQIKQKQQLIMKLKRQLKYYQQHPSQDLYPYVKKLQKQNRQMKQEIQELLHLKNQHEYTIQIQQTSILVLSQQIQALKAKIYQMELAELSGIKQMEKNSEMKNFQENVENLKQMLDKSKLKMIGMKEQFDKLKAVNQQLVNQRSTLAKRAAVGFGQLTPRPNIKAIFNENCLIYEDFVHLTQKNTTTQNITKSLVQKIKKLKFPEQKQKQKQKIQKEDHFEDAQDENNMKNAIEYIDKTKQQVRKTVQSVGDIKKSLNRQISQKQTIQRAQNRR